VTGSRLAINISFHIRCADLGEFVKHVTGSRQPECSLESSSHTISPLASSSRWRKFLSVCRVHEQAQRDCHDTAPARFAYFRHRRSHDHTSDKVDWHVRKSNGSRDFSPPLWLRRLSQESPQRETSRNMHHVSSKRRAGRNSLYIT
jgi:hypothetical protein